MSAVRDSDATSIDCNLAGKCEFAWRQARRVRREVERSGDECVRASGFGKHPVDEGNEIVGDEFTRLIQAQRGYELNSKVVQAWDDVQHMANDLRSA